MICRQGDVLITKINALPSGDRKKRENGILAYGEVTGHCHKIDAPTADVMDIGDGMFLVVGESGVRIVHDEHSPICLPPGEYEVTIQREYSPEAIRNVAD